MPVLKKARLAAAAAAYHGAATAAAAAAAMADAFVSSLRFLLLLGRGATSTSDDGVDEPLEGEPGSCSSLTAAGAMSSRSRLAW